ncbi:MAG TPA: sigma-70 family RNA polymerase sigma factor [Anaerolineae bacterium]|nr:sigma-70 family RNA polymerase sigma factor [Anaerolineae bacterium]
MAQRTNAEWLNDLQQPGDVQASALADLREYLLRAAFVYLRDGRSELHHLSSDDLMEMAEDFAQNALITLQANLHKFRGDAKFTTWAYRFVINEAAGELRKRRYRDFSWDELTERETAVFTQLLQADRPLDPTLQAEREELIRFLVNIIETELKERQRIAILCVHFQGRSMQETAEILETSPNTLYKTLHDARKKIKAKLLARHYSMGDILALFDSLW